MGGFARTPGWLASQLLALLLLSSSATPASAQRQVVIYRCTDAHGALTIQNDTPCAKGSKQRKSVIDVPPPMPVYESRAERMPTIVAAEEKKQQQQIQEALPPPVPEEEREPPPALFQCTTWDQNTYLTEDETPPQRCAPLNLVGLNGRPVVGAAQACQNVADQCIAVPDDELCKAWQRRADEAKFRWKFAETSDDHARELEYEQHLATLRNSTCGQ